jgi:hypothetical protein
VDSWHRASGNGGDGMRNDDADSSAGDVYFEFTTIGTAVKVAAIDAKTGLEVVIVGPATAAKADLERLAVQKLKARLARRQP